MKQKYHVGLFYISNSHPCCHLTVVFKLTTILPSTVYALCYEKLDYVYQHKMSLLLSGVSIKQSQMIIGNNYTKMLLFHYLIIAVCTYHNLIL